MKMWSIWTNGREAVVDDGGAGFLGWFEKGRVHFP